MGGGVVAVRDPRVDPMPGDVLKKSWPLPLTGKTTGVTIRVSDRWGGQRQLLRVVAVEGWIFREIVSLVDFQGWAEDAEVIRRGDDKE